MSGLARPLTGDATSLPAEAHKGDNTSRLREQPDFKFSRLAAMANGCVRVILIATIICLIGITFRSDLERGHVNELNPDFGAILYAVCANLSHAKYHTGRYVCAHSAEQQMHDAGLWYTEDVLARVDKTLPQWLADGPFLNQALAKVFRSASLTSDGGVYAYGWGGDAGYMDYMQFAFGLFGTTLTALYYGFFLLLSISTALFCIQFWNRCFVLFTVLAFQFSILASLHLLPRYGLGSLSSPRLLSTLSIIPMFHALFLVIYRVRLTTWSTLLFVPQALLTAAAADFRSLSYDTVIALTVCCLILLIIDRLRLPFWRYWPVYVVFACLLAGVSLQSATADARIPEQGGMRFHTFWEPLFWDLETDPTIWSKYRTLFQNATGDGIAQVAVQSYRERHNLLHVKTDFLRGEESLGITQVAYEEYTREAYLEFVREHPSSIMHLKYFNALQLFGWLKHRFGEVWSALDWRFLTLSGIVALALIIDVRGKFESLQNLSIAAALVTLSGFLIVLPVWATAISPSIMTDLTLLNVSASFVVALWALVCIGVLLSNQGCRFVRSVKNRASCSRSNL